MKEITEYRKASAEWMGLNWDEIIRKDRPNAIEVVNPGEWYEWTPDTDLNQMGMIEDKLIDEGCETHCSCERLSLSKTVRYDYRIIHTETERRAMAVDKSKPIAFMKAFMKYHDQMNEGKSCQTFSPRI